ncbi:MAG: pyruvoyl-dependent arginine decarboxylase [Thermoplasmata archaeon]
MILNKAEKYTVKSGTGRSSISSLNAFDRAMVDASIGEFNLIEVSSVLPVGIEKVDEISNEVGDFVPSVLAKATGRDSELAAGIAWGFRDDDKGGYVMEHSIVSERIDMDVFEQELRERLFDMGKARGIELCDVDSVCEKILVGKDEFGCALTGLVFTK